MTIITIIIRKLLQVLCLYNGRNYFNCVQFGHLWNAQVCLKCSDNHSIKTCSFKTVNYPNCNFYYSKRSTKICPSYKYYISTITRRWNEFNIQKKYNLVIIHINVCVTCYLLLLIWNLVWCKLILTSWRFWNLIIKWYYKL